jgi:hypothetical protein
MLEIPPRTIFPTGLARTLARGRRQVRSRPSVEALEQRLTLSAFSGEWRGTLTEGSSRVYGLQMDLTQIQNQVQGTSFHTIPGNYHSYLYANFSGTVAKRVLTGQDVSIISQVPPPIGHWLLDDYNLHLSNRGDSITGTWSSGDNTGDIHLSRVPDNRPW